MCYRHSFANPLTARSKDAKVPPRKWYDQWTSISYLRTAARDSRVQGQMGGAGTIQRNKVVPVVRCQGCAIKV